MAAATDVGGDAVEGAAKLEDVAEGQGDGGATRGATRGARLRKEEGNRSFDYPAL